MNLTTRYDLCFACRFNPWCPIKHQLAYFEEYLFHITYTATCFSQGGRSLPYVSLNAFTIHQKRTRTIHMADRRLIEVKCTKYIMVFSREGLRFHLEYGSVTQKLALRHHKTPLSISLLTF